MSFLSFSLEGVNSERLNVFEHDVKRSFSILVFDFNLNFVIRIFWLDNFLCLIKDQSACVKSQQIRQYLHIYYKKKMQTLTKRKERIAKQLSKSDSLFFLLEVEHLFSEEKEVVSFFEKEDPEREEAFESIASRYVPIVGRKLPNCCDCGGTIERGDERCVCDTCCKVSTAIEGSDLLHNKVSNYDRKPKFLDCILRYQARQDVVIDKKLFEKYLSKHYADLSKVTKKQIFLMLITLGMKDQVENLHLIHYELTGVPPKDIGHLVPPLIRDFEILIRGRSPLSKVRGRSPLVSVRQVFYHLLKKNGVPCCKEEFGLRKDELLFENPPGTTSSNDSYRS